MSSTLSDPAVPGNGSATLPFHHRVRHAYRRHVDLRRRAALRAGLYFAATRFWRAVLAEIRVALGGRRRSRPRPDGGSASH